VLPDARAQSCSAFCRRGQGFWAGLGIETQAVMTDNAKAHRRQAFRQEEGEALREARLATYERAGLDSCWSRNELTWLTSKAFEASGGQALLSSELNGESICPRSRPVPSEVE
jgi:hypothetical protein